MKHMIGRFCQRVHSKLNVPETLFSGASSSGLLAGASVTGGNNLGHGRQSRERESERSDLRIEFARLADAGGSERAEVGENLPKSAAP